MIRCLILWFTGLLWVGSTMAQKGPFSGNQSTAYPDLIAAYQALDNTHSEAKLLTYGTTDSGQPLHLFVISRSGQFDPAALRAANKRILLINNGIHAGEPCGVDASLRLARNLLTQAGEVAAALDDVVVAIIPFYNIGGALNRGCCSRANQNGPEAHGFRGNARLLDLNRDFIKMDSRNARAFVSLFQAWDPDVFVDTHTTNGADYPYVLTLIATQANKLHPILQPYVTEDLLPHLSGRMETSGYPAVPYVYSIKGTPDKGIADFLDSPRYSSGYAALFHTISFITEAHMFKPFEDRVNATYHFLAAILQKVQQDSDKIGALRQEVKTKVRGQALFPVLWQLDTTHSVPLPFRGYTPKYKPSAITGAQRLYYDREAPFERDIPYYNRFEADTVLRKPRYYLIPQAWGEVIDRLQWNGVRLQRLSEDQALEVHAYYIEGHETGRQAYEGHYPHKAIAVRSESQTIRYQKGDYVVPVDQERNRFIVESLEPMTTDSYFAWNFFDEILQQKEWFSSYVFEEEAVRILEERPKLKQRLEARKAADSGFATNPFAQLLFIYRNSEFYEPSHNRYPVTRIYRQVDLPLE
ncbi:MAG: M14 family zinc carboxypeptidase [Bacteroidota bacterium]